MSRPILVAVLVLVLGGPAWGQAETGVPGTTEAPMVSGGSPVEGIPAEGVPLAGTSVPEEGGVPWTETDLPGGGQFWGRAEYLLGWIHGSALPALITTSPPDTPKALAGIQGAPTTTVLFGGTRVNDEVRSGFRFNLGYCFDVEHNLGAQVGFFVLESQSQGLALNSDGSTVIARPIINPADSTQLSILVAYPGVSSGSINAIAGSHALFGFNADLTETMFDCSWFRMESLFGYRCLRFDDRLVISQTSFPVGGPIVPGTRIVAQDSFGAQNTFHGLEFGVRTEATWGSLSLELLTKLGAGWTRRNISILGGTSFFVPGAAPTSGVGGLLALTSNIGNHEDDEWALVPEVGLTLGWQVTENLRLRAGYTVMLWSQVARAGEQVDLTVNQNLIPPAKMPFDPQRPQFRIQQSDLVLQALNFGLELRY